jgi:isoquinoline 1-oxidoreductase alpha subunit
MLSFTLNDKRVSVSADQKTPLLWVIRDHIGLTGTKYGCGAGLCGACTVHINGKAEKSCMTPVANVEGAKVVTIEGLSSGNSHPLQKAWIAEQVAQCGYCQSGQIMSAVALLSAKPKPTDADVDGAMTGNLCRCATYMRIRAAIHQAAKDLGGA